MMANYHSVKNASQCILIIGTLRHIFGYSKNAMCHMSQKNGINYY